MNVSGEGAAHNCLHAVWYLTESAKNVAIVGATLWLCRATYRVCGAFVKLSTDPEFTETLERIRADSSAKRNLDSQNPTTAVPAAVNAIALPLDNNDENNDTKNENSGGDGDDNKRSDLHSLRQQ